MNTLNKLADRIQCKSLHCFMTGMLCLSFLGTSLASCDKLDELKDAFEELEKDDETEPPYTSPYEDYDSTATAMILKPQTKPTEGLYGTGEADNPYLIRNAPELKYFINAVSDFATHADPIRKTKSYNENLFLRTVEGNPMIDKAYKMVLAAA